MKTLKNLTTGVVLVIDDAGAGEWIDENKAQVVEKTGRYVNGTRWASVKTKIEGRPITLTSRDDNWCIKSADIDTLNDWANVEKLHMEYTHDDGRAFKVKFRHRDGTIESQPVFQQVPEIEWHDKITLFLETV